MRVSWSGAWCYHGNSKCGCICNRADTCTHTNLHLCHRPHDRHPPQLVWKTRRLRVWTGHCSQITHTCTHTKPHTSSLEAVTPAYGALCQVGHFFLFFSPPPILKQWVCLSTAIKRWSSQARCRQSKTKQRWGISMQLKSTSCKCEGTWCRHSIFKWRRQRGRGKKGRKKKQNY